MRLNARFTAALAALLLCTAALAAAGSGQQRLQAGGLAAAGARAAAAGASGPLLQRRLLDDDDHEREHDDDDDDDDPRGWNRKGAASSAPASSSTSGGVTEDSLGAAARTNATAVGAAVKPVVKRPTPAAASKGAMPFSDWVSNVMPNDAWLMLSFVVAWFCAPGLLLLLWPFVFDGALSACDTMQACAGRKVSST